METVVLDGTQYIKASVAAKRFKYTSDYIGQLCRAKKIDARLVGRTWFVNPDSIIEHKDNKFSSVKTKPEKKNVETSDITSETKEISSVLKSKTARAILTRSPGTDLTRSLIVNYEPDEESLIPKINKKEEPKSKNVVVKVNGSKNIRVKGGVVRNTTKFIADELPEVALSGKLKIAPYPEPEPEPEEKDVVPAVDTLETPKNIGLSPKRDSFFDSNKENSKDEVKASKNTKVSSMTNKKTSRKIKFSPNSVAKHANKPVKQMKVSRAIFFSPLIASVLAILCVGLLFSASSNATVTSNSYQGGVMLQVANLLEVLNR